MSLAVCRETVFTGHGIFFLGVSVLFLSGLPTLPLRDIPAIPSLHATCSSQTLVSLGNIYKAAIRAIFLRKTRAEEFVEKSGIWPVEQGKAQGRACALQDIAKFIGWRQRCDRAANDAALPASQIHHFKIVGVMPQNLGQIALAPCSNPVSGELICKIGVHLWIAG